MSSRHREQEQAQSAMGITNLGHLEASSGKIRGSGRRGRQNLRSPWKIQMAEGLGPGASGSTSDAVIGASPAWLSMRELMSDGRHSSAARPSPSAGTPAAILDVPLINSCCSRAAAPHWLGVVTSKDLNDRTTHTPGPAAVTIDFSSTNAQSRVTGRAIAQSSNSLGGPHT